MSSSEAPITDVRQDVKDGSRTARLGKPRKTQEEVIKRHLISEATEKCKAEYHKFGECAKENGILVAFKCRGENRAISDCMERNYSEDMVKLRMREKGYDV